MMKPKSFVIRSIDVTAFSCLWMSAKQVLITYALFKCYLYLKCHIYFRIKTYNKLQVVC